MFNIKNPDSGEVFYQSCAFAMKKPTSDIFMSWTWLAVNFFEGENDGLLAPRAAEWTNFKGVFYGSGGRGISHCDEVEIFTPKGRGYFRHNRVLHRPFTQP